MSAKETGMSFDDPSVPEEPYVLPPEPPAEDDLPPEPVTGAPGRPAAPGRHAGAPGSGPSRGGRGGSAGGRDRRAGDAAGGGAIVREMPQNVEAEQGVLGGMMLSKDAIADVVERLRTEDFYRPAHQTIFDVMLELYGEGKDVDPVILAGRLDNHGQLDLIGGAPYIHSIVSRVPTAANVGYYADIVAEKAVLRRLVSAGTRIVQYGYSGLDGAELESVVDRAQQEMFAVTNEASTQDYESLHDLLESTMDELDMLHEGSVAQGIKTGFHELDDITNGLRGGQMIIVAARPGVGKSTLALDFMRSCSIHQGKTSALFSLEMSKSEVMMRIFSAEAEVPLSAMRGGRMDDAQWEKLTRRIGEIDEAPIFIDDSPNLTMMEIRAKARRLKQQHDLSLIVVDYLQLMSSGRKVESRQQEVSEFSRQLKLLAKECDVPLVAISQLNRGVESRGEDAQPRVSDLRESGSLEQDADMVMLISRPDAQNRDHERAGEADIILAKHRGGPIGTIQVAHQLHYSKFANLAFGAGSGGAAE
ncbi:replicative DNA helicase [Corynebacterium bovis]|uniref:Replicative DNA helicase n=5 Tax=Corynebacterium bovis TaxID=36808 RepID=A0A426Q2X1_9CORY|nr:replicative DNA helicase [Corynebacterium bovis]MDK8511765.1 replicative DNA helicase [Corynebacterium bovis]RRO89740.1 replicative DNA helicase [Corynebacterium bovis]RRO98987.1 replicative DNA helicase [Corynebacterium bovis]RRQ02748.1 replicative DNA helicase [Corynebacterium bovis]RRQ07357.1 replicative DNA helicase [Corynebacterium bovis]